MHTRLCKQHAVLSVQLDSATKFAVVLRMQTSDLLAGLRLAADTPPAAVGTHEEAGGGISNGSSQVLSAQPGLRFL